jgi:hypothetical protein
MGMGIARWKAINRVSSKLRHQRVIPAWYLQHIGCREAQAAVVRIEICHDSANTFQGPVGHTGFDQGERVQPMHGHLRAPQTRGISLPSYQSASQNFFIRRQTQVARIDPNGFAGQSQDPTP